MNLLYHYDPEQKEIVGEKLDKYADLVEIMYTYKGMSEDVDIQKQIRQFQEDVRDILFSSENCLFARPITQEGFVGCFNTVRKMLSDWTFEAEDSYIYLSNLVTMLVRPVTHMLLLHRLLLNVDRDSGNTIFRLCIDLEYVDLTDYAFTGEIRKHILDNILDTL